ncbi:hypothetical protein ABZV60_26420 [Streptomyces sp. NPDC004787]|uniref:hypothetical protein n=1 Tax=Streptomyces sp. NPDC004787 TaxID=3154291 RepID=UPI0033A45F7E
MHAAREEARHNRSSKRITVGHGLAGRKRRKKLTGWTRRREALPAACQATAGLASDRAANV